MSEETKLEIMPSKTIKQVIVMRNDLNMRKGKMIAQGSHASMAFLTSKAKFRLFSEKPMLAQNYSFINEILSNPLEVQEWMEDGFTKVCVRCESEEELVELYNKSKEAKLNVELITDSGLTEFAGVPTKTCIAIGPNKNEEIDKITGHLKLL